MKDSRAYIIIFIVFICTIFCVNPWGDFAINDDWNYLYTLEKYDETGEIKLTSIVTPSVVSHLAYGLIITEIFGFDYDIIRLSTLTLAFANLVLVYLILIRCGSSRYMSVIGSLCMLSNPVYVLNACSYMTDVPAITWALLQLYVFLLLYKRSKIKFIVLCYLLICIGGVLCRQTVVAVTIASCIVSLIKKNRRGSYCSLTAIILSIFVLYHVPTIISIYANSPETMHVQISVLFENLFTRSPIVLIKGAIVNCGAITQILGVFLFPVGYYILHKGRKIVLDNRVNITLMVILISGSCLLIYKLGPIFSTIGNNITAIGMGPILVRSDITYNEEANLPILYMIAIFGSLFICMLLTLCGSYIKKELFDDSSSSERNYTVLISIATVIIYIAPFHFTYFFDRYMVFVTPFLLITVIGIIKTYGAPDKSYVYLPAMVFLTVCFSIILCRDYFSIQRKVAETNNVICETFGVKPIYISSSFELMSTSMYKEYGRYVDVDKEYQIVLSKEYRHGIYTLRVPSILSPFRHIYVQRVHTPNIN